MKHIIINHTFYTNVRTDTIGWPQSIVITNTYIKIIILFSIFSITLLFMLL
jgi:hypothetical protein